MDKYNDATQFNTAGFFRRLLAKWVDGMISSLFAILIFAAILGTFKNLANTLSSFLGSSGWAAVMYAGVILLLLVPISVLVFLYSWFFTYKFGGTLGKLLFGMRILKDSGGYVDKRTAFWRMTAGYAASSVFMCLGYFWIFRKKENLAWHDRLFGTRVVRVGKPIGGIVALLIIPVINILLLIQLIVPMFTGLQ